MNDEAEGRMLPVTKQASRFILHPPSSILHPSSFILHPSPVATALDTTKMYRSGPLPVLNTLWRVRGGL